MDRNDISPMPHQSISDHQRDSANNQAVGDANIEQLQRPHNDLNPDINQSKKLGFSIDEILRRTSSHASTSPQNGDSDHEERTDSPHYVTSAEDERLCLSRGPEEDVTFDQQSEEDEEDCLLAGGEGMEGAGEGYSWLHCTRYKPPKLPRSKRKDTNKKRKLGRNPRVPFTQHQVSVLEQKFRQTHYLSSVDVAELSATLNLTETRVKIWFQNRRARERRDKSSPPSLEKDLHTGSHYGDSRTQELTSLPGDTRLVQQPPQSKYSPSEEQFKIMSGHGPHHPFNVLHTAWGGVYHPLHGLFGIRPLGVQHYDSHQQRVLAQQRMLALQRHSAFTPVMHGLNGANRQVSSSTE